MRLLDLPGPIAYFVSFRAFGTWLHGDPRGSTDRRHNVYGEPWIPSIPAWASYEVSALKTAPVRLGLDRRRITRDAIIETSLVRNWTLRAVNVRTNHAHVVVSALANIKVVRTAFKANATRQMRLAGVWTAEGSPWSRGGSARYIWNAEQLARAIRYVEEGQGPDLD